MDKKGIESTELIGWFIAILVLASVLLGILVLSGKLDGIADAVKDFMRSLR